MLKGMVAQHGFQSTSACKEPTSAASLGGIIKIFLLLKLSKASGGRACFLLNSNSKRQYSTLCNISYCTVRGCVAHTYTLYACFCLLDLVPTYTAHKVCNDCNITCQHKHVYLQVVMSQSTLGPSVTAPACGEK